MTRTAAFGEAVRARRKELGLSQERLGYRSELDQTYISDIERGVRNPTLIIIWRLADALGVDPSVLLDEAQRILNSSDPEGQTARKRK
jgi:transcriptional regulator with XRE-family HTH domain